MGRFNPPELNLRQIALPPLLGVAVFVVASFSMRFPHWTDQTSSLWLATGVSLAALLRTPRREWPMLVAASVIGTMAASLYAMNEPWYVGLSRSANNALEYCLCAWVVRRQCGSYFDLTEPRHLAWLAGSSTVASLLKLVGTFTVTHVLQDQRPAERAGGPVLGAAGDLRRVRPCPAAPGDHLAGRGAGGEAGCSER